MSLPNKQEKLKILCQVAIKNGKGKATMIYSLLDTISAHPFALAPALATSHRQV